MMKMLYTHKELLNKYKSNYQIEKAVKENKIFKIEKGIYSNKKSVHYLEVLVKKYPKAIITGESAYYYHNLTDVIPDRLYLYLAIMFIFLKKFHFFMVKKERLRLRKNLNFLLFKKLTVSLK